MLGECVCECVPRACVCVCRVRAYACVCVTVCVFSVAGEGGGFTSLAFS